MDISLLVIAEDRAPYKQGDVVDVSLRHYDGCSHQRFVLVHIEGIPDTAPTDIQFKRLKGMFEAQLMTESREGEVRRRAWRLKAEDTAAHVMSELVATRETVITWEVAKVFLGKKIVSDIERPETDDLVFISDDDV